VTQHRAVLQHLREIPKENPPTNSILFRGSVRSGARDLRRVAQACYCKAIEINGLAEGKVG